MVTPAWPSYSRLIGVVVARIELEPLAGGVVQARTTKPVRHRAAPSGALGLTRLRTGAAWHGLAGERSWVSRSSRANLDSDQPSGAFGPGWAVGTMWATGAAIGFWTTAAPSDPRQVTVPNAWSN